MTLGRHFPKTYPAKVKIPHIAPLPAALKTAPNGAGGKFRFLFCLEDHRFPSHILFSFHKWYTDRLEKPECWCRMSEVGDQCNLETEVVLRILRNNFGKNTMVFETYRQITFAVDLFGINPPEIPNSRKRYVDHTIQEVLHSFASQGCF